jgi:uncharacterized RDD family membrane protein YckC
VNDAPPNPPRWAPDPLGRHEYRYWDGGQWTEHVSDNGMAAIDPPTAMPPGAGVTTAPHPATSAHASGPAPGYGSSYAAPYATATARRDPTAVMGRRYGAFFIDLAICLVAFSLLFFPFATKRTAAETLRLPGCHLSSLGSSRVECDDRAVIQVNDTVYEANTGAFLLLAVLFTFLYFAVVEAFFGGSLGKQMTGVRIVTASGDRIGLWRSGVRWLLFVVDGPLTLFLCGIITSAVSRGHRRLGDMAADAYVVGRDAAGQPVSIA